VISEADAIFTILEAAGLLGNAADSALAARAGNDDVFTLPADT
jgi:hypothetical protein